MQRTYNIIAVVLCSMSARAQFSGPAADSGAVYLGDSAYVLLDLKGAFTGNSLGINVLAIPDYNHDGYDDFAVTWIAGTTEGFNIYLGGKSPASTPAQIGITGKPVAAGDLNNDGNVDLAVFNVVKGKIYESLRVYFGDGQTFDTARYVELISPNLTDDFFGAQSSITDVDGDGRNELVVLAQRSHTVYIYKYADTGLVREPWFVWKIPISQFAFGPFLNLADIDDDGIPDLCFAGQSTHGVRLLAFVLWGRSNDIPDTTTLLRAETDTVYSTAFLSPNGIPFGNLSRPDIKDMLLRSGKGTRLFPGLRRRWTNSDFDTARTELVLRDPVLLDSRLDYLIEKLVPVGNVNGNGLGSLFTQGYRSGDVGSWAWGNFMYSGGNALNDRFDGAIDLTPSSDPGDTPGDPVDIGDIDGDSLHEIAIPDVNYENATGRVLIIRGSTAYPHKPVRTDVASDGPVLQWGAMANYPNPCTSETTIETSNMGVVGTRLRIFDMLGNEVFHCEQPERRSFNSIRVSTESWNPGIYCCELLTATGVRTHLISKVQ